MPPYDDAGEDRLKDTHGVKTAILSLSVPGATMLNGQAAADLARAANEWSAKKRDGDPARFGFFASVPSLLEKDFVLKELEYALDVLKADGVTLFSRYGDGHQYLGHPDFDYLWAALEKRAAVAFVHPTHTTFRDWFNKLMAQPVIDFPLETTKTAVDLVVNGHMKRYPDVKIILSHGGGALPYLIQRPASGLGLSLDNFDHDDMIEDAKKFYFDTAITGHELPLSLLEKFAKPGHIVFGSDFPYATPNLVDHHIAGLDRYEFQNPALRADINYKSALKLFPRLAKYYT